MLLGVFATCALIGDKFNSHATVSVQHKYNIIDRIQFLL